MEFSRQEYWSGLPFPPPGDLPDPGVEPTSPALIGRFFTTEQQGEALLLLEEVSNYVTVCVCVCGQLGCWGEGTLCNVPVRDEPFISTECLYRT